MKNEDRKKQVEIRTDLALEARESFPGDGGEIEGVELNEWENEKCHMKITEVVIKDQRGAAAMQKPVGIYLTLEAPKLAEKDDDFHKEVANELAVQIRRFLQGRGVKFERNRKSGGRGGKWKEDGNREAEKDWCAPSVLVVGLGNPAATPDALGPLVLGNLQVTRHLSLEYGREFCERNGYPVLSGLTPGVMAQTGMETAEIVYGVIKEARPEAVIVVDALAARSAKRLGTTIQLSDTGIRPGSGVGNHRNSLTEETLHIPVLAIGVPTVISAAAVVHDTIGAMIETLKQKSETRGYGAYIETMDPDSQYELIREFLEPEIGPMYVTPHDIDERVKSLSYTISEAIHEALFR